MEEERTQGLKTANKDTQISTTAILLLKDSQISGLFHLGAKERLQRFKEETAKLIRKITALLILIERKKASKASAESLPAAVCESHNQSHRQALFRYYWGAEEMAQLWKHEDKSLDPQTCIKNQETEEEKHLMRSCELIIALTPEPDFSQKRKLQTILFMNTDAKYHRHNSSAPKKKNLHQTPMGLFQSIIQGSQGKSLQAGTDAEAMDECCLQSCSPWSAQFAFFYHLEPPVYRWHCP
ncbi:hypothetical protein STEG23_023266 [Scotinomys teguina]